MPSRPSKSNASAPQAQQPAAQPVNPDIDEGLHSLWQKYGQAALIAAALVLVFYLAREGWAFFGQQRESSLESEFAQATTPSDLRAFAAAHPDRELAGVADLELGDQDYAAGNMIEAVSDYADAARILKGKPLADRAATGLAVAQIQAGQTAEGEAGLRRILEDANQVPVVRVEAGSELAVLAAARGDRAEVYRLANELTQIDANSPWTQRAFALIGSLAPAGAPAAQTAIKPAPLTFKPPAP